jgi:hypothetical protein
MEKNGEEYIMEKNGEEYINIMLDDCTHPD